MKIMFAFSILIGLLAGCAPKSESLVGSLTHEANCGQGVYDYAGARCIGETEFIDRISRYPVIFVGDIHHSAHVHARLASMIDGLHARGYHIHLANEWFLPSDEPVLQRYLAGDLNATAFQEAVGWQRKAGYAFELYAPIYEAVRRADGHLYGINLGRESRNRISDANVGAMTPDERSFFEGLDLNVGLHRSMLAPFLTRCHAPKAGESDEACIERIYRVQAAWDSKMAQESARVARMLDADPRARLIVFAGAWHLTYGAGVNMRFARLSALPFVTVLPENSLQRRFEHGFADYLFFYPPVSSAP